MAQIDDEESTQPGSTLATSVTPSTNMTEMTESKQDDSSEQLPSLGLSVHSFQNGDCVRITVTSPEFDLKSQEPQQTTKTQVDPTATTPNNTTTTTASKDANDTTSTSADEKEAAASKDANGSVPTVPTVLSVPSVSSLPSPGTGSLISCVVDVSGSMRAEATIKDENGVSESHGLTILDLVKHSIKTIVHCLSAEDRLCIVSYSNKANVVMPLTQMDASGRSLALKKLDTLYASGQTNLWGGLELGLDQLNTADDVQLRNSAVMLFTDGLPNIRPGKGEVKSLDVYNNGALPGVVHTYGFGYSLDSPLLNDLARRGRGSYHFIPDSSFVGTIFVNSISNFASNVARDVRLRLNLADTSDAAAGAEQKDAPDAWEVLGGFVTDRKDGELVVHLGSVAYGQSKTLVLSRFRSDASGAAPAAGSGDSGSSGDAAKAAQPEGQQNDAAAGGTDDEMKRLVRAEGLSYVSLKGRKRVETAGRFDVSEDAKMSQMNYYRLRACEVIEQCMEWMQLDDKDEAQGLLKQTIKQVMKDADVKNEEYIKDLLKDLKGQMFEALETKQAYNRWGRHYLLSLMNAHLHQFNNNFKDPGVQHYGGKLFETIKDKADKIFVGLPPPTATTDVDLSNVRYRGASNKKASKSKNGVKNKQFLKSLKKRIGKESAPRNVAAPKSTTKTKTNFSMHAYYNAAGGCFGGDCSVKMEDGSQRLVKELQRGDRVSAGGEVLCVVRVKCKGGSMKMCRFEELSITPWHPIKWGQEWVFPRDVQCAQCAVETREFVYNFVVEAGVMCVGGFECVALGHERSENDVVTHEYFGSRRKVLNDLKKMKGWSQGCIDLTSESFRRDSKGLVVGMTQL